MYHLRRSQRCCRDESSFHAVCIKYYLLLQTVRPSVIFAVDEGLNTLTDFRHIRKYCAGNGEEGGKKNCHGKNGKDIVIKVPAENDNSRFWVSHWSPWIKRWIFQHSENPQAPHPGYSGADRRGIRGHRAWA